MKTWHSLSQEYTKLSFSILYTYIPCNNSNHSDDVASGCNETLVKSIKKYSCFRLYYGSSIKSFELGSYSFYVYFFRRTLKMKWWRRVQKGRGLHKA